jgi:four helix bundle protein
MKINRFEDIEIWKDARILNKEIYFLCKRLRDKGEYILSDQIKRCSVSIMANVAEGFGRGTNKEFKRFLFISKASASELSSHLYIALDVDVIDRVLFDDLYSKTDLIQKKLSSFINYLRKNEN